MKQTCYARNPTKEKVSLKEGGIDEVTLLGTYRVSASTRTATSAQDRERDPVGHCVFRTHQQPASDQFRDTTILIKSERTHTETATPIWGREGEQDCLICSWVHLTTNNRLCFTRIMNAQSIRCPPKTRLKHATFRCHLTLSSSAAYLGALRYTSRAFSLPTIRTMPSKRSRSEREVFPFDSGSGVCFDSDTTRLWSQRSNWSLKLPIQLMT